MRNFPALSTYWSEDEGRRGVEAWQRSGENAAAFSRRHGVHAKQLVYWGKRLRISASPTLSFVPAAIVTSDGVAAIIRAPGGTAIELASATAAQIATIANALVRSSP